MTSLYIGVISGTSVDGIDIVLIDFSAPCPKLLRSQTISLPDEIKNQLLAFNLPAQNELENYAQCDVQLGRLFAKSVNKLLQTTSYTASDIAAIGSHGQTIRHYPEGRTPTTLQIGDPNIIAELTGITTVADFRRRDMAAGGQGAPLVPAFHAEIFRQSEEERAILNLGGIANLTLLPADQHSPVIGFDTGPANCLLNDWIQHCKQQDYDTSGLWAASARVNQSLLDAFLHDAYFKQATPKSTGRDYFQLKWIQQYLKIIDDVEEAEVQSTLAELTAQSIASDLLKYAPATKHLFVCGGGIHNNDLLQRLHNCLPGISIESTEILGIHPDFVEATAFAWLARQTLSHQAGSLSSVTGARHNCILGGIYPA